MKKDCLICKRINLIKNHSNPFFVKELKTSYVVMSDYQFYKGYTLLFAKQHCSELHELGDINRREFLQEMAVVAEAVFKIFQPKKLNYELLGNTDHHLHWHIIPRHYDDPNPRSPIWVIDMKKRYSKLYKPSREELIKMIKELSSKIADLI